MNLKEYINKITSNQTLWSYYVDEELEEPDLNDPESCKSFIEKYIQNAHKGCDFVSNGLSFLWNNPDEKKRLCHIVDTYFLGISLYKDKRLPFGLLIREKLSKYEVFKDTKPNMIDREFCFVWFMITLFHDLGYMYERGHRDPSAIITNKPKLGTMAIPEKYERIYKAYLEYRDNKDHGIDGGLEFDKEICEIRSSHVENDKRLSWKKELEEVYHDVAWVIIAHNIWWHRTSDKIEISGLKQYGLTDLLLSDKRPYEYPININKYPLLFLFCLVDILEPLKRSLSLEDILFTVSNKHIRLRLKKRRWNYISGVMDLDNWLTATMMDDKGIIDIDCHNKDVESKKVDIIK